MTQAKRGLHVRWFGYGKRWYFGKIQRLNTRKGTMMLDCTDGLPWQAQKVGDGWYAYSGSNTFTFKIYLHEDTA